MFGKDRTSFSPSLVSPSVVSSSPKPSIPSGEAKCRFPNSPGQRELGFSPLSAPYTLLWTSFTSQNTLLFFLYLYPACIKTRQKQSMSWYKPYLCGSTFLRPHAQLRILFTQSQNQATAPLNYFFNT